MAEPVDIEAEQAASSDAAGSTTLEILVEMEAYRRMVADPSGVHGALLEALNAKAGGFSKRRVQAADKAKTDVLNRHRADLGLPPEPYPWEAGGLTSPSL